VKYFIEYNDSISSIIDKAIEINQSKEKRDQEK